MGKIKTYSKIFPWVGALIGSIIGLLVAFRMDLYINADWMPQLNLIIIFAIGSSIIGYIGKDIGNGEISDSAGCIFIGIFGGMAVGGIIGVVAGIITGILEGTIFGAIMGAIGGIIIGGGIVGMDIGAFIGATGAIGGSIGWRIGGAKSGAIVGAIVGGIVATAIFLQFVACGNDECFRISTTVIVVVVGVIAGAIGSGSGEQKLGVSIACAWFGGWLGYIFIPTYLEAFFGINIPIFPVPIFAIIGYFVGTIPKKYLMHIE